MTRDERSIGGLLPLHHFRRLLLFGFVFLGPALLIGCTDEMTPITPATDASSPSLSRQTVPTERGAWTVTVTSTPNPVPLNEHFSLEVEIKPSGNASSRVMPSEGVRIEVDADMPAHGHGINTEPEARRISAGRFEVEGLLFHMPGAWELYIDVFDGSNRDRAVLPLTLE